MDYKFTEKTLKLLADPNKLKHSNNSISYTQDKLKRQIEMSYSYILTDELYHIIKQNIYIEIEVDKLVKDIIYQAIQGQNLD
jgi:predicted transcriptional regulator